MKLKELPLNDPFRLKTVREFLEKLYAVGLIPTADTLERASKVSASSFCRRRLPVCYDFYFISLKKRFKKHSINYASTLPCFFF